MDGLRVVVAQLGAREHYAIPRMLQEHGALIRLHTDFWSPIPKALQPLARKFGGALARRANGRFSADIPERMVRAHSMSAIYWNLKLRSAKGTRASYTVHSRWGRQFAKHVADHLSMLDYTCFFGFSSAALEALRAARRSGALAVLDAIAPVHLEEQILAEERKAFPGWEPKGEPIGRAYLDRLEEEWAEAGRIVVNSEWTKRALAGRGVAESKMHIVPIGYNPPTGGAQPLKHWQPGDELKVLWLGTLCLRKGLPYAIAAARRLQGLPVRFTFAGPSDLDLRRVGLPSNATYAGPVPRSDASRLWAAHHVFLLPTLSDGFAITQVEAMAHGLPIISTACCGDVVENGRSGQIVPPRDPRAIADAIQRILDGAFDLAAASQCALLRARDFAPDTVWPALKRALLPSSPGGRDASYFRENEELSASPWKARLESLGSIRSKEGPPSSRSSP